MHFVVVSDSHGRNEVFTKLRELHPNADAYLCCGDSECGEEYLDGFVTVKGNNDYLWDFPHHVILDIKGIRIYMTHGDRVPRLGMLDHFSKLAQSEHCSLFLFGHTHIYEVVQHNGITIVNPGSIHHNRDGSLSSYALISVQDGQFTVERKSLDQAKDKTKKKGLFF